MNFYNKSRFDHNGKKMRIFIFKKSTSGVSSRCLSIDIIRPSMNILYSMLILMLHPRSNNPARTIPEISWKQYSGDRIYPVPPGTSAWYSHRIPASNSVRKRCVSCKFQPEIRGILLQESSTWGSRHITEDYTPIR